MTVDVKNEFASVQVALHVVLILQQSHSVHVKRAGSTAKRQRNAKERISNQVFAAIEALSLNLKHDITLNRIR